MARIRPFRGLRYDLPRAGAAQQLMAPPYDVVDEAGRAALASRSEHNCIHFILPEGDVRTRYEQGAARFRAIAGAAMVRDEQPSIYVYHQRFEIEGHVHTRKGFVALIELTRFGQGPVLAHERTLAGPKQDRLELMRACQAHLELVFGLFSDPQQRWETLVSDRGEPVLEAELDGVHHALWRESDPQVLASLTELLADRQIYIADGHHRYETMCTFRDELAASGHPEAQWGMIYLSNLDDPGLVVLPTHRLVHSMSAVDLTAVLDRVAPWFRIEAQPLPTEVSALRDRLQDAGRTTAAFGLSVPGSGRLHVLRLRDDFDPAAAGLGALAPALQRLDVALLHELVLERALGIGKAAQEAKTNLHYYKSSARALEVARHGGDDTQLVCFMNATPVADVRAVCDSGEVMPQKSTFFHPKIPNGLVFHDLEAAAAEHGPDGR
jgi:uncharacterized protein (DUF1015 family)